MQFILVPVCVLVLITVLSDGEKGLSIQQLTCAYACLVTSEKNNDFQIISTFGIRLMEVASLEKIGRIIIRLTGTKKSTPTFIGN